MATHILKKTDCRALFIVLAYRGEPFHGWQRQPNDISVQQKLEEALSTVLRQQIAVTGAGRTDAGVNASRMVAHFDAEIPPGKLDTLPRALNSILGSDITVYSIRRVNDDAHARFDAVARTYRYFLFAAALPLFARTGVAGSPRHRFRRHEPRRRNSA